MLFLFKKDILIKQVKENLISIEIISSNEAPTIPPSVTPQNAVTTSPEATVTPAAVTSSPAAAAATVPLPSPTPALPPKEAPRTVTSLKKPTTRTLPVAAHSKPSPGAKPSLVSTPTLVSYEQILSSWFKKHKRYDSLGEREVMLRIRLNKNGKVIFYHLDKSTGNTNLDQQIIRSLQASVPFPPFPASYTTNEAEFLLPLNMKEKN